MKTLSLLLVLITNSVLYSQTVSIRKDTAILNLEDVSVVGNLVLAKNTSKLKLIELGIVDVTTEAENVTVKASDVNRNPVNVEELTKTQGSATSNTVRHYIINGIGKIWVDVVCIDFKKNIYVTETKLIELVEAVQPDSPNEMSPLAKSIKAVVISYTTNTGKDFETTANNVTSGKFTTVTEANNGNRTLNDITSVRFKRELAAILSPLLGNAVLPNNAANTYQEIAKGFKGVK